MESGTVATLWRYPVKSMQGEEVNRAYMTSRGLYGDRAFALVDAETGKVASAKNPSKWPSLFAFRAAYTEPIGDDAPLPPVRVTLPNGDTMLSTDPNCEIYLSKELGREVTLESSVPVTPTLEEYWPDVEGLARNDEVTDEAMPPGTFFDLATIHILTTATLDELRSSYPAGRFETRRFRPNIVIDTRGLAGFAENEWIGKTIRIGDAVRLDITGPCPRCVMTTLAQGDLPKDPGVLRAAVKHNDAHVGVYASTIAPGRIRPGDKVFIE